MTFWHFVTVYPYLCVISAVVVVWMVFWLISDLFEKILAATSRGYREFQQAEHQRSLKRKEIIVQARRDGVAADDL